MKNTLQMYDAYRTDRGIDHNHFKEMLSSLADDEIKEIVLGINTYIKKNLHEKPELSKNDITINCISTVFKLMNIEYEVENFKPDPDYPNVEKNLYALAEGTLGSGSKTSSMVQILPNKIFSNFYMDSRINGTPIGKELNELRDQLDEYKYVAKTAKMKA